MPSSEGKGNDGFFKDGKEDQGVEAEVWIQRAGSGVSGLITLLCDGFPVGSCRVPVQQVPAAVVNTQMRPGEFMI